MITLVPCPDNLLKCVAAQTQHGAQRDIAGSWVLTQDPVLISDAGAKALQISDNDTKPEIIVDMLNRRLGVPPGCSRIHYNNSLCSKPSDSGSRELVELHTLSSTKWMSQTSNLRKGPFRVMNTTPGLYTTYFEHFDVATCMRVTDPAINELTLLTLASKSPKGITITSDTLKRIAKLNDKYRCIDTENRKRIRVVDKNFLIEATDNYDEWQLVYNPKRAKRLITLRSKKSTATTKDRPWQLYTCYTLLYRIWHTYHTEVRKIEAITWLYGYGRFCTQGIAACMRILPRYAELTARLGLTGKVRKLIHEDIRLLTYHKSTLFARGSCTDNISSADYAKFMQWYNTETKFSGIPKDAEARFKQLKAKLAISRSKFVAAKIAANSIVTDVKVANDGILLRARST